MNFLKAVVVPNTKKDVNLSVTKNIVQFLLSKSVEVVLDSTFQSCFSGDITFLNYDDLFLEADFVVTVGGDGTILKVAEKLSELNVSVIGVNLGRMGFMAEIEPNEVHLLENILESKFTIDKRMMLDVDVVRGGRVVSTYKALNDIVVSNGRVSKMSELELYCDDTYVSTFHSDGIIVSTPTGSTAYSLSAGGAIIDPTINCLLFTPVCPHSFYNARPIVFSPNNLIQIKAVQQGEDNTYLTVDGSINEKIFYSDLVNVKASKSTLNLIKIKENKFYDRVYQKISERK